jgi:hypothetical protein
MRRTGWFLLAMTVLCAGMSARGASTLLLGDENAAAASESADSGNGEALALPLPAGFLSEAEAAEEGRESILLADDIVAEGPPRYSSAAKAPVDQGQNNGGAHFSLDFSYANRYVYRGVDHDAVSIHGNSLNLLFDGQLSFDLGNVHPYVGLFTNIDDGDPVSRFQEVRPYAGIKFDLRPFELGVSNITNIYPEREQLNQSEVDFEAGLDDSLLFGTHKPWFSPYILGAYYYSKNQGWYFEAGVHHDIVFEDLGLTITGEAAVGYISGLFQQFVFVNTFRSTGWQHWEVGLLAKYSLNNLLHFSQRYGEFDVQGYGYYDGKLNDLITSNNVLWGGVGLSFKY